MGFFRETLLQTHRTPFRTQKILSDLQKVLTSLPFWQLTLFLSLAWAVYLSFLSFTSVLFVVALGLSKKIFPLLQASFLGSYVFASLMSNRALLKRGVPFVKKVGISGMLVGGISLVFTSYFCPHNSYVLTVSILPFAFGLSWAQTPYFSEIMEIFPAIKGTVASLLTSLCLLIAVLVVALLSQLYNGTIWPLTGVIVGSCGLILALLFFYERRRLRVSLKKESEPLHL